MVLLKYALTFSVVELNAILLLASMCTAIHMNVLSRSYLSNKNEVYNKPGDLQLHGILIIDFLKRNFLQMTGLKGFESLSNWFIVKMLLFYEGVFVYVIYLCHSFDQFRTLSLANSAPEKMSGIGLCGTVHIHYWL